MFQLLFLTDHSPIMLSFSNKFEETKGKGLWKHNNSLWENSTHMNSMKKLISPLKNLKNENINDGCNVWEYVKYEIRFSKNQLLVLAKLNLQYYKPNLKYENLLQKKC